MQDITTFITNHPFLSLMIAVIIVLLMILEWIRLQRNTFQVTPFTATQLINRDKAVVIDIRPTESFNKGHIIDAESMPAQELKDHLQKLEKFKGRPIIIVCTAGVESQKIAALLLKQGYNAYSLASGMRAWKEANMPIVKE